MSQKNLERANSFYDLFMQLKLNKNSTYISKEGEEFRYYELFDLLKYFLSKFYEMGAGFSNQNNHVEELYQKLPEPFRSKVRSISENKVDLDIIRNIIVRGENFYSPFKSQEKTKRSGWELYIYGNDFLDTYRVFNLLYKYLMQNKIEFFLFPEKSSSNLEYLEKKVMLIKLPIKLFHEGRVQKVISELDSKLKKDNYYTTEFNSANIYIKDCTQFRGNSCVFSYYSLTIPMPFDGIPEDGGKFEKYYRRGSYNKNLPLNFNAIESYRDKKSLFSR